MIAQARLWWSGRSTRERLLLGVMAALFAALFVGLGIVRPLDTARSAAALRLDAATLEAARVRAVADALRSSTRPAASFVSLPAGVASSAATAGLTLARLDVQGANTVAFTIAPVRSQALFAWIDALDRQGVMVEKIALRTNSDGTLSVDGVLRTRTR